MQHETEAAEAAPAPADDQTPAVLETAPPAAEPAPVARKRGWTDHMITIRSAEKVWEAWSFARSNGMETKFAMEFMKMLGIVAGYHKEADARDWDLRGHVGFDGCKHSFSWHADIVGPLPETPRREHLMMFNGGLIYHGRGSGETFAMTLTSGEDSPWQIHT